MVTKAISILDQMLCHAYQQGLAVELCVNQITGIGESEVNGASRQTKCRIADVTFTLSRYLYAR